MIEALFFYLFAGVMLASGFMVVVSRNPVYSVLFLILAFFNAAGMFDSAALATRWPFQRRDAAGR